MTLPKFYAYFSILINEDHTSIFLHGKWVKFSENYVDVNGIKDITLENMIAYIDTHTNPNPHTIDTRQECLRILKAHAIQTAINSL